MKVYFVSGLAADSRVFKHMRLPASYVPVFLDWIEPLGEESLKSYALRLAEGIDTGKPFALVGLSMGGMIAAEIARQFTPVAMILISSAASSEQLPFYFKVAGRLGLHKLLPVSFIKSAACFKRVFTAENPEDKLLLQQIIRSSSDDFICWAMNAILQWESDAPAFPYIHIHGARDEVLPLCFTRPTHIIKKGKHLMIMNHAGEINTILEQTLADSRLKQGWHA